MQLVIRLEMKKEEEESITKHSELPALLAQVQGGQGPLENHHAADHQAWDSDTCSACTWVPGLKKEQESNIKQGQGKAPLIQQIYLVEASRVSN